MVGQTRAGHRRLNVEQHCPARDAVPSPVVDSVPGAREYVGLRGAVVELIWRVTDVTEGIPLARGLRIEVVVEVVEARAAWLMQDGVPRRAA